MSKCTTCHEADGTPHDWWSEGCYGPCTAGRNGHEAAFRTWSILSDKAAAKEARLPCSWLGALLGVQPVIVRLALEPIQRHCLREDLPPLNVLAVNKKIGRAGAGFTAASPETLDQVRKAVRAYPWRTLPNPFAYASDGTTQKELVAKVLEGPVQGVAAYRRTGTAPSRTCSVGLSWRRTAGVAPSAVASGNGANELRRVAEGRAAAGALPAHGSNHF